MCRISVRSETKLTGRNNVFASSYKSRDHSRLSLSVSASKGSDKLHRQTFPPALNNTWCCLKKKLPTTEFQQKRKWTMLKSTIFVFFFSFFLGRLDCAGKPFVPVKINLFDRGSVDHSVWLCVWTKVIYSFSCLLQKWVYRKEKSKCK